MSNYVVDANVLETRVLSEIHRVNGAAAVFDPTPYIGVATALIGLLRDCRNRQGGSAASAAQNIRESAKRPTLLQRGMLRRHLRGAVSRDVWQAEGENLVHAALTAGVNATPAELASLIQHEIDS